MEKLKYNLDLYIEKGIFTYIDKYFANFIQDLSGSNSNILYFTSALLSSITRKSHICIDLKKYQKKIFYKSNDNNVIIHYPEINKWINNLDSKVTGKPGEFKPFILDEDQKLYFYRYYKYQCNLSQYIKLQTQNINLNFDFKFIKKIINKYFISNTTENIDWQKLAVITSLLKNLCIITGGPGSGKTTTVILIIILLLEKTKFEKKLNNFKIVIAAPTGKAANKLRDTITSSLNKIKYDKELLKFIPDSTFTIHRLLGCINNSPFFKYTHKNKLNIDVLIIDESSMIDLALMSKLFVSLKKNTKLILIGDKNQLSSVEAGAIWADICDIDNQFFYTEKFLTIIQKITNYNIHKDLFHNTQSTLFDSIVELKKNYRFPKTSGIYKISQSVKNGQGDESLKIAKNNNFKNVTWHQLPDPEHLTNSLRKIIIEGYKDFLSQVLVSNKNIFNVFDNFRILCAFKKGSYGVISLNNIAEKILSEVNLINKTSDLYIGRPVMITKNDYNLDLFNGDIGLFMQDKQSNNDIRVFFPSKNNRMKKYHPHRIPPYETVYAMTIHKSQGSEFNKVLLITPDKDYDILTRELIYTGITRAKQNVEIYGNEKNFIKICSKKIQRSSGLKKTLWIDQNL